MTAPPLTARVFPGRPEQAGQARAWVRALAAAACPPAADDAALAATELAANAIAHTRSGQPGGTVTIAVIAGPDGVTIHVHDQGTNSGQVPPPRPAADDGDGLAEGGRGLPIVLTVSAACGIMPAARCPVQVQEDPAAGTGGYCTWCHLAAEPQPAQNGSVPLAAGSYASGQRWYRTHECPGSGRR